MVESLKCTVCGGDLKFTPMLQKWKCEWCDKEHTEEDLAGQHLDQPVSETVSREETAEGVVVTYKCSYCGAEVVTAEETSATFCVYCQRPVALLAQLSGEFKPACLIPFKNTKEKAMEQFKNFLKGKRFLPNAYRDNQNIEKLTGVYIPFWFFDGTVYFDMSGEGDIVTHSRSGDYKITKTDTYGVVRRGQLGIKNIPVDASKKTPDDVMDSIEPFDFSELRQFATPYLSGFLAERYDVSKEEVFPRARKRFEGSAEKKLSSSLTKYNRVRRHQDVKRVENVKAIYGLLPVWLLYSRFSDKNYLFAMNGQTDKILGNLPMDRGKMVRFAALVFGVSGFVCAALAVLGKLANIF